MKFLEALKFNEDGLIPAIMQEEKTGRVLMVAWMNREALLDTIKNRKTYFWSRSRKKYWLKGESSGHFQIVKNIAIDCDGDVVLLTVEQLGGACHEGFKSCFFREVDFDGEFKPVQETRVFDPAKTYSK